MIALERSALGSLTPLGSGGQGNVFRAPKAHINFASSAAFKEYKAVYRSQVDFGALEAMSSFLAGQTFAEGSRIVERVAWPISLVADQGRPVGFLMPEVPDSFAITLQLPSGATKRDLAQFQHLLNPGTVLARRGIAISERDRYLLLAHLAESLALLHSHDVVVGDLSPKNVLFSLDPTPRCFFVDADAMRLAGRSALPQAETPDWEIASVSSEPLATKASDSYKLGLFVLRLLAGDQSTRNAGSLPRSASADVRDLLARSLSANPASRPAPTSWVVPLRAAATTASTALPVLAPPKPPQATTARPPAPRPVPPAVVVPAAQPAYVWSPAPSSSTAPGKGLPWGKLAGAGVAFVIVALVASNLTHSSNPGNNGYNPSLPPAPTALTNFVPQVGNTYQLDTTCDQSCPEVEKTIADSSRQDVWTYTPNVNGYVYFRIWLTSVDSATCTSGELYITRLPDYSIMDAISINRQSEDVGGQWNFTKGVSYAFIVSIPCSSTTSYQFFIVHG